MSKINNQSQSQSQPEFIQDISSETAASYSGGRAYKDRSNPDIYLYLHANRKGPRIGFSASRIGDEIRNLGKYNWNDKVSSIWVRRGEWDFFQDSSSRGDNTNGLRAGKFYNLGHNNDAITSFKRIG